MTFKERYDNEPHWAKKIIILELFHLTQKTKKKWGYRDTAKYFGLSLGLVAENMKLAIEIHKDESLMECVSRNQAIIKSGCLNNFYKVKDDGTLE